MYDNICHIPPASFLGEAYGNNTLYSDVTWLTAHNAFANTEDGWRFYYQQTMNQENLFEHGVRSFTIDLHYLELNQLTSDIYLCHGDCAVTYTQKGGAPDLFSKWLKETYDLLEKYPNEVITLHLESYVNSKAIEKEFIDNKLDTMLLKSKNPNDKSLTFEELRKTNQRLIVFSDYGFAHGVKGPNYPIKGIHSTIEYKETQYSLENFKSCEMRTDNRALPESLNTKLFVLNHIPTVSVTLADTYAKINRYCDIMSRVESCVEKGYGLPNFIVLDFVEKGACAEDCSSGKIAAFLLNHYKKMENPARGSVLHQYSHEEPTDFEKIINIIKYHGSSLAGSIFDYKATWMVITWIAKDYAKNLLSSFYAKLKGNKTNRQHLE